MTVCTESQSDSSSGCQRGDCRCTEGTRVLAVDTSHLYVLWRAAKLLAPTSVKDVLLAMIDAHSCCGTRHLVSSAAVLAREVTGCAAAAKAPELSNVLGPEDLEVRFSTHDDSHWAALPGHCPPGGRIFGDFDRRLVASAESAGTDFDEDVYLATDDEDLLLNLTDCLGDDLVASMPIASVELLLRLVDCEALDVAQLEAVLEAEDARLRDDQLMQPRKRIAKEERLAGIAARLGLIYP
jgi:hypothetical protein